ncbi:uncharacterized protein LOC108605433 isoform X2 [Drosophila busckii]|uniref:uncharacterized protein LOC108605433 isoform X2 n=1 Tax=Drosophila busckii TaxID=30019 RepID=UPI00083F180D|nr:uncharacterized protein LOC108605433 isoform X2 [Drosophila busckii]
MSTRKYKNPVNNHFIYNDETRKSTCKICYFDMAGRHSENLMRHLKRKHSSTYAEVMLEKQRRRSTIQQQKEQSSSENNACQLSSLFSFETEPHGLRIKSEVLAFRLEEPKTNQQLALDKTKPCSIEIDTNDVNPTQSGQFESVYLGKFEMREDTDETLSQMPDNKDNNNKHNEEKLALAVRNETKAKATTPNPSSVAAAATTAPSCSSAQTATNSEKQLLLPQQSSSDDDGFFLQYLGNKFSKYTPNAKHTVQFHINRILYKADMGCYDNITDASKLPDVE